MVQRVEPVLRASAATSEAERRLAPEAMEALIDAGILRAGLPAAYGGAELGLLDVLRLIESLSYIDGAAGWVTTICAGIPVLTGILPKQAADELFADPRTVCCGAWYPPGSAEPVQGGYKVTGHWSFASGSNYANWLTGQALVTENGAPKMNANGMPTALLVFFPAREAEIIENWDTLGMRGTGSQDFRVQDVFVPEHRAWAIGPWAPVNPAFSAPIYRMGAAFVPPAQAAVTLGIARAAIDDLIALAQAKTPSYTMTGLADKPVVQDKIARARAVVDAARSYSDRTAAEAEELLRTQPGLSLEQRLPMALAGSFGIEAAMQAVDLVHACAGTSDIRNERRFQQYFRDVHTLSQHAFSSPGRFESVGKLMLGRESDWPFHYV
jgi:alkylation response protein AidB-like acyl-CoA dehydrogenase